MNKLVWIDILKGIGILLVIIGHVYLGEWVSRLVYMFHMPLFFFISGYLFNFGRSVKQYFVNKTLHLIVPYFSFLILVYIPGAITRLPYYSINSKLIENLILIAKPFVLGGRMLTGWSSVFWFVTCLFLVQQIMNILINYFSKITIIVFMFLFLGLSYVNSIYYPDFWLPLNANVVFAAAPIYYIGYLCKEYKIEPNAFVIVMFSIVAVLILFVGYDNYYDMKYAKYGIPFVTIASSISLIFLFISLSRVLSESHKLLRIFFSKVGDASMMLMFLHQPVQMILRDFANIGNPEIRLVAAIAFPYLLYLFALSNKYGRAFLLGSQKDFINISGLPVMHNDLYK